MGRVSDARERLMKAVSELIWTGSYGSTTIDQICDRAGVKKGSFYYFFESKADLAVASLDVEFQKARTELDSIFSATRAPLERIALFCDHCYQMQERKRKECGCVLGCPLFTLGSEVSTQEQKLREKVEEILEYKGKYLTSAIREADAAGLIEAPDPAMKARVIRAYFEGLLTQARIQNNLEVLREGKDGVMAILGVKEAATAS